MLGVVARLCGFSIWRFLAFIRDALLIVLGTSASEAALPQLTDKLERLGCPRGVVGLVVPTGYSFDLDGRTKRQRALCIATFTPSYLIDAPTIATRLIPKKFLFSTLI